MGTTCETKRREGVVATGNRRLMPGGPSMILMELPWIPDGQGVPVNYRKILGVLQRHSDSDVVVTPTFIC
jgi:hypothetical protein